MLNAFRCLKMGDLNKVNSSMLYPLLRWASGSKQDLAWCSKVNKYFFFVPSDVAKGFLSIGLRDKNPYVKYPKAQKEETNKIYDLKKSLAMQYYFWSSQEFERNKSIIDLIDWNEIATALGCDKKERKLLGLSEIKYNKKPKVVEKKKPKTLFEF